MSTITAYPLSWPLGHPRTHESHRDKARFSATNTKSMARRSLTVAEAVQRVIAELERFTKPGHNWRHNRSTVVISTNVPTRQDGLPRGGLSEPADPGAAVYFQLDGRPYCLPCDTYTRVADNLAAIAATLESTRTIERHGVVNTHNVYADFKALPEQAGPSSGAAWWQVLGVQPDASAAEIRRAYRAGADLLHPDRPGGSHDAMSRLNQARADGLHATQQP